MLIIPIQNKPDWSKPPIITIGLILVNLLVFLIYQGNDGEIADQAAAIYETNNLLPLERDHYVDYLRAENPQDAVALEAVADQDQQSYQIFWSIFYDRGFDQYLEKLWEQLPASSEEAAQWQSARDEFEQERNRLSSIAAGLTPAEAKPWTFISSLFLHGGWAHLVGNMVFLFLFGFTLESVLRPHAYIAMYLVSGIAADVLFIALNPDSWGPLVGASGAISGLMGMYLSLYRLRKIRFFYTVVFYFGEFRAPALFILPLWLAKELYGHFFTESNTAYWAHIGGLLAGAALMFVAQKSQQQFTEEEEQKTQKDEVADGLNKVRQAMTQLDYTRARTLTRWLCQKFSTDPRPWCMLFDLHKIQPRQKAFHETTFAVFKQFTSESASFSEWQPHMELILKEYVAASPLTPALTGNVYLMLARKYWLAGVRRQPEEFIKAAQERNGNQQAAIKLLTQMTNYYRENNQNANAKRLAVLLEQLQQPVKQQV